MIGVGSRARLAVPLLALLVGVSCGSDKTEKVIDSIPRSPRILGFEISPSTILPGETATLAWATSDALSIAIADHDGRLVSIEGRGIASGSVPVSPAETTSYKLTAYGKDGAPGPTSRTVTITVDAGIVDTPTIETFAASPDEIAVGGTVTLSWRTSNATALVIKDDAGVEIPLGSASLTDGSVGVKPTRSPTSYTLIATGGGRRATAGVSVAVIGLAQVHRFSLEPVQPVAAGTTVQLIWETSRSDRVVIEDERGTVVVDSPNASGVQSLRRLRCQGSGMHR